MANQKIAFDFSASPNDANGVSDQERYETMFAVTRTGYGLGYENVWTFEHNFTDYLPVPNPLLAYAHMIGQCPGLGLGTCVMVIPWHNPLFMASQIAMLSIMGEGHLHLGVGRGTAPIEYLAYGKDMTKASVLFRESMDIIQTALKGKPFTYKGSELSVDTEVEIRPHPRAEKVTFYCAVVNPESTTKAAESGMAMLSAAWFPLEILKTYTESFDKQVAALGETPREKAITVNLIVCDTDEEATQRGHASCAEFFRVSMEHYETGGFDLANFLQDNPDYASTGKFMSYLKKFSDPAENGDYVARQLIGSPKTVIKRVQDYVDAGYTRLILQTDLHGTPRARQQEYLTRFAKEVAPKFGIELTSRGIAAE